MSVPVIDRLVARGAVRLDVPLLQPAEPFLELAGEDLRRRVFLAEDERGRLRCLRPELTIPAAREHLRRGAPGPVRYALAGTVFRQRDGADEFPQAGIETIGGDMVEGDARAIAEAVALVDELAPGRRAEVTIGDRAIYAAALGAIGLPGSWAARLVRVHGDPSAARVALSGGEVRDAPEARLGADLALPEDLAAALAAADRPAAEAAIANAIARTRMGKGTRTAAEIAGRLMERHGPIGGEPSAAQIEAIERLLELSCALDRTATDIRAAISARDGGAGGMDSPPNGAERRTRLDEGLEAHGRRLAALRAHGVEPSELVFRASLGRSLDYYTGLVFEVRDAAGTVLAAGGRYDRLLGLLGGTDEPAVGFALWLDRLGVGLDGARR